MGGLVALLVVAALILIMWGTSRINKDCDVQVASVPIPTDAIAIERGRHFVETIGLCSECRGDRLQGDIMSDDPIFGTLAPPNLTSGVGGIGSVMTDTDYVRAIRHGIGRDGESLLIMPSNIFNAVSDADLGAVIAYFKTIPPVDNQTPETSLGPLGKAIVLLESEILTASVIDHTAPRPPDQTPGVTAEYGKYLAAICTICHGDNFSVRSGPRGSKRRAVGPESYAKRCACKLVGIRFH